MFLYSPYVDDTTLFGSDKDSVIGVIDAFGKFFAPFWFKT